MRASEREGEPPLGPHSRARCGILLHSFCTAITLVYFVQGVLGLSELATSFYLKDELHLDPAQV